MSNIKLSCFNKHSAPWNDREVGITSCDRQTYFFFNGSATNISSLLNATLFIFVSASSFLVTRNSSSSCLINKVFVSENKIFL